MAKTMCELCHEEPADYTCVSCEKDICAGCESGYYSDEDLCRECRAAISPEEEAEDIRLTKEALGGDEA